jgi:alpha-galactosidase
LAAPLIAGNDLRTMSQETKDILINKEVIAVNQDSLGIQGFKQNTIDSVEVWYKPLKGGDWALCFLNRSVKPANFDYDWKKQVIFDDVAKMELKFDPAVYTLHDLWAKKDIGNTARLYKVSVPGHDVMMLRLRKKIK